MSKKAVLTLIYAASFVPMFFRQYGYAKGVSEWTGIGNLLNPITIIAIVLFIIGVWATFQKTILNTVFSYVGMIGVIIGQLSAAYILNMNWIRESVTTFSDYMHELQEMVLPKYYVGLIISVAVIVIYFVIQKQSTKAV